MKCHTTVIKTTILSIIAIMVTMASMVLATTVTMEATALVSIKLISSIIRSAKSTYHQGFYLTYDNIIKAKSAPTNKHVHHDFTLLFKLPIVVLNQ